MHRRYRKNKFKWSQPRKTQQSDQHQSQGRPMRRFDFHFGSGDAVRRPICWCRYHVFCFTLPNENEKQNGEGRVYTAAGATWKPLASGNGNSAEEWAQKYSQPARKRHRLGRLKATMTSLRSSQLLLRLRSEEIVGNDRTLDGGKVASNAVAIESIGRPLR